MNFRSKNTRYGEISSSICYFRRLLTTTNMSIKCINNFYDLISNRPFSERILNDKKYMKLLHDVPQSILFLTFRKEKIITISFLLILYIIIRRRFFFFCSTYVFAEWKIVVNCVESDNKLDCGACHIKMYCNF